MDKRIEIHVTIAADMEAHYKKVLVPMSEAFNEKGKHIEAFYKRNEAYEVLVTIGLTTLTIKEVQAQWAARYDYRTTFGVVFNSGLTIREDFYSTQAANRFIEDVNEFIAELFHIE